MRQLESFAIVSSKAVGSRAERAEGYSYETTRLIEAARSRYGEVFYIDPFRVTIEMKPGSPVRVFHRDEEISDLATMLVRGTGGIELPTRSLVQALIRRGCDVVDPPGRFSGARASKMVATISRHQRGVGSCSCVAFDVEGAGRIIDRAERAGCFPLLQKDVFGKKGRGIRKLEDADHARRAAREHFAGAAGAPFMLQLLEEIADEYRVLLIHGRSLGVVRKVRRAGVITANAAQGTRFEAAADRDVERYVEENAGGEGLIGADVAATADGRMIIIETNRAPEWRTFDEARGGNAAEPLIEAIAAGTIRLRGE